MTTNEDLMPRPHSTMLCCIALIVACGGANDGSSPVKHDDRTSTAPAEDTIQVGGLYASQDEDGTWRVTKVLAIDEHAVHLRSYANKFPQRPNDIDPAVLTLGSVGDPNGFGIGHFPLDKQGFAADHPQLIKVVPVSEDELDGYRMYLDAR